MHVLADDALRLKVLILTYMGALVRTVGNLDGRLVIGTVLGCRSLRIWLKSLLNTLLTVNCVNGVFVAIRYSVASYKAFLRVILCLIINRV